MSKISYNQEYVEDIECALAKNVKLTLDRGLQEGSTLVFHFPGDSETYTDVSTLMFETEIAIKRGDGSNLDSSDRVFYDWMGLHALFSTVDTKINGQLISNMSCYPYSSRLQSLFGTNQAVRMAILRRYDHSWSDSVGLSNITEDPYTDPKGILPDQPSGFGYESYMKLLKNEDSTGSEEQKEKVIVMKGFIYSDFLMSCKQLLPPSTSLTLEMRRSPSEFFLCNAEKNAKHRYKVVMKSASVSFKRLHLSQTIHNKAMASISSSNGGSLIFTRLNTRLMNIPANSRSWRWLNLLEGAPLPQKMYVGFVNSRGLYGSIDQLGTFFESLNLESLALYYNSQPILTEPLKLSYKTMEDGSLNAVDSDARNGFLTMTTLAGHFSDPLNNSQRLDYSDYINGGIIYGFNLGLCGTKSGEVGGFLDLVLTFSDPGTPFDANLVVFLENTRAIPLSPQ